jgi:predicted secreted protein
MRRLRFACVALAVAILCCMAASAPVSALTPHSPVFTDPAEAIAVQPGDDFFIALASNETTGFRWSQTLSDGKIAAYEGNVYQALGNGLPGAGGQQLFIYHANRTGSTTVVFTYARSFEPNVAPAKTVTFTVNVQ